jgi:glycosyltransferase involved in cell wall biosynthesis
MGGRRVAVIANGAFSLINFRGPLLAEMVSRGCEVFAFAPDFDEPLRRNVRALGVTPVDLALDRIGIRPVTDLARTFKLAAQLRRLRIEVAFCYFLKPVIFGTIAAWLAGVRRRYTLVAGLGYIFIADPAKVGFRRRMLRRAATAAIGFAFRLSERVFFQNADDLQFFVEHSGLDRAKTVLVAGTGVDLDHFCTCPLPNEGHIVLFVGRLLNEKGVRELIEAARILKQRQVPVLIVIAGGLDLNLGAIAEGEVREWVNEGLCEWVGHVDDVRPVLGAATVFVLPSYREGKPRSTQEALAIGRPVITTDAVGCRDTVQHGVNGWLVPVRDAVALADAIEDSTRDRDRLMAMAAASRTLAEEKFDVRAINAVMLDGMGLGEPPLGGPTPAGQRSSLDPDSDRARHSHPAD